MKLIELLVQELPKHGGWPEGVALIDQARDGMIFDPTDPVMPYLFDSHMFELAEDWDVTQVTREQYEAALAASQPQWNGEGLPPVGTICMANLTNGWTDVKVAYIGEEYGWREALVFEVKSTKPAWADEFRPIRSEADKKRDEAGLALYHAINWNAEGEIASPSRMEDYKKAYDAIAAGKIPGVKIEG